MKTTTASYFASNTGDAIILEPQGLAFQVRPGLLKFFLSEDPSFDNWKQSPSDIEHQRSLFDRIRQYAWTSMLGVADTPGAIIAVRRGDGLVNVLDAEAWDLALHRHDVMEDWALHVYRYERGHQSPSKPAAGYVHTDTGEWLVQLPDASTYGFYLADEDQTWPGGFGAARSWRMVPASEVPADVQERLGWLLE